MAEIPCRCFRAFGHGVFHRRRCHGLPVFSLSIVRSEMARKNSLADGFYADGYGGYLGSHFTTSFSIWNTRNFSRLPFLCKLKKRDKITKCSKKKTQKHALRKANDKSKGHELYKDCQKGSKRRILLSVTKTAG